MCAEIFKHSPVGRLLEVHTVRLGVLLGKSSVGAFERRVKVNIVNAAVVCKFKQIGIEAVDIRIKAL